MVNWRKTGNKWKRKATTAAKKRYFKGGKPSLRNTKIVQIAKDVNMLKNMVNAEKKRIDEPIDFVYNVSQSGTLLNSSGYAIKRQLFAMPEGTGHRERNGNSIKCHSYHLDIKAEGYSVNALRATLYLVRCKEPQTLVSDNDIIGKLFKPSAFDNKYDLQSPRNYENMNDFQIVASKNIYIPADTMSGTSTQMGTKITSLGGKLNFHQRTKETPGAHTDYDTNELVMVCLAERGTPTTDVIKLEMTGTMYFYDN